MKTIYILAIAITLTISGCCDWFPGKGLDKLEDIKDKVDQIERPQPK